MARNNDLRRLDDVAQQVGESCTKPFRQAVDAIAGTVSTIGLLKALLMTEEGDGLAAAGILCNWLINEFEYAPVFERIAARSLRGDRDGERCRSVVKGLLKVSDISLWRAIDEEALSYLSQLKLYAKSVVKEDPK
ncbi:hypothetical protein [Oryzibacter oryziterrae]|uniref:hypothetical protein n=1 Tax=Oryzibacter oryziterrae TaxID=2766474 RepID=UPI001F160DE8|nr:hypothetical protein [Oryzibacter oryziterrae]